MQIASFLRRIIQPARLYSKFPYLSYKRQDFSRKKNSDHKMCPRRSTQLSEIFPILRRKECGITPNVRESSRQVPVILVILERNLELSRQVFEKSQNFCMKTDGQTQ